MPCPCTSTSGLLDTSNGVPAPRAPTITGGGENSGKATRKLGVALVVIGIAMFAVGLLLRRRGLAMTRSADAAKNKFWTPFAEEEPTRPYQPYTGTEPYGSWDAAAGTKPWAEAVDLGPIDPLAAYRDRYW